MSKNISFVSETQIEEKRKLRQEEWQRTRKTDDPLGCLFFFCLCFFII